MLKFILFVLMTIVVSVLVVMDAEELHRAGALHPAIGILILFALFIAHCAIAWLSAIKVSQYLNTKEYRKAKNYGK